MLQIIIILRIKYQLFRCLNIQCVLILFCVFSYIGRKHVQSNKILAFSITAFYLEKIILKISISHLKIFAITIENFVMDDIKVVYSRLNINEYSQFFENCSDLHIDTPGVNCFRAAQYIFPNTWDQYKIHEKNPGYHMLNSSILQIIY